MIFSQILKILRFSFYLFILSFGIFFGGFACSGMGGGASPTSGAPHTLGGSAASPGTSTPIADALSTPMTFCYDKEGRLVPCSSVLLTTADEREYSNDYRISGKNTAAAYELIDKDFRRLSPLRIQKDGPLQFYIEQFTESTPGDPSTWDWHHPEPGAQVRLVVFPKDDSGTYRFIDSVTDLVHIPGAYNVLFKNIPLRFGDRVELWLYSKSSVSSEGKTTYEKYPGYNESGGNFDSNAFIEFVNHPSSYFLGTFRVMEDMTNFELKTGPGPRVEGFELNTPPSSP